MSEFKQIEEVERHPWSVIDHCRNTTGLSLPENPPKSFGLTVYASKLHLVQDKKKSLEKSKNKSIITCNNTRHASRQICAPWRVTFFRGE